MGGPLHLVEPTAKAEKEFWWLCGDKGQTKKNVLFAVKLALVKRPHPRRDLSGVSFISSEEVL